MPGMLTYLVLKDRIKVSLRLTDIFCSRRIISYLNENKDVKNWPGSTDYLLLTSLS